MTTAINFTYRIAQNDQIPVWIRPAYFVHKDEQWLRVEIIALKEISGLDTKNAFLTEGEVLSVAEGDFLIQHPIPIGHNPVQEAVEYSKAIDRIFCVIDKSKPCNDGSIRWDIPLKIFNVETLERTEVMVTQEYCLRNRELTILKGGSILVENLSVD